MKKNIKKLRVAHEQGDLVGTGFAHLKTTHAYSGFSLTPRAFTRR